MYSGKRSKQATERRNQKRNQRIALNYYITITSYHDSQKQEVINTRTQEDNAWFLQETFGVVDSGVIPCYGFDGCVLEDSYGTGARQQ